jgi:hypothetical protein
VHQLSDIEWNAEALRAELLQVLAQGEPLVDFEITCSLVKPAEIGQLARVLNHTRG